MYTIDVDQGLVTITGEYADAREWKDLLTRILRDPARKPGFAYLRDLRAATKPVDAATVVEIAAVVRRFWPVLQPSRVAVLTPRGNDPAALVAQALADTDHTPLLVFRNYDEAIDWLAQGRSRTTDQP